MTHLRLVATTTFDSGIVVHTYNPKIDRRDESEGQGPPIRIGRAIARTWSGLLFQHA